MVQNIHYIELFTNQTYMHLFLNPELCHAEHPFSSWKFMKCPWTSGLVIGACYSCHWSQCDCFYFREKWLYFLQQILWLLLKEDTYQTPGRAAPELRCQIQTHSHLTTLVGLWCLFLNFFLNYSDMRMWYTLKIYHKITVLF